MSIRRIHWTLEETTLVAKESYKLMKQGICTRIESVRATQERFLPKDRQRNFHQMDNAKAIQLIWDQIDKGEFVLELEARSEPLKPKEPFPQAIKPLELPEEKQTLALADIPVDVLAQELLQRLLSAVNTKTLSDLIRKEVNQVLDRRLPGVLAPDDYEPPVEEPIKEEKQKHKVCIIGLLGGQQSVLKNQYGDRVDFHFLDGNEGMSRIKNTAERMDLTIKTQWVKGVMGSTKGIPRFVNAHGLDSIRMFLRSNFALEPK